MLSLCCKDRQHNISDYTVEVYILWLNYVEKGLFKKKNQHVPEKTRETAASLETEAVA